MLPTDFVSVFAALFTCYYSFSFLHLLIRSIVYPLVFSKRKNIKEFGKWIVITGSTDGIGKAFAKLLAEDGYNLVLISRSDDKLKSVKEELTSAHKVEIKTIKADFTKADIYDTISEGIKGLEVGMLINNVGMSYSFPSYIVDDHVSSELASNILNCNCLSTVLMTRLILKAGMFDRGGFILNISSEFGVLPGPFLSIYAASKAFMNSFSLSVQLELKHTKVILQNVEPNIVATNMSRASETIVTPSPMSYANGVLNRLGTYPRTNGCFMHELLSWFVHKLPDFIIERVVYSTMVSIRQKALDRIAKDK